MKKKLLPILLFSLFTNLVKAQSDAPSIPIGPSFVSPQVADMIRYDATSSLSNLGEANVTIPVLGVNDPDFDIDISLSYAIPGFKPLIPDNIVGMGWRLNSGGIIMREIHGIPDDYLSVYTSNVPGAAPRISVRGYTGFPNLSQSSRDSIAQILFTNDSTGLRQIIREAGFGNNGEHMSAAFSLNNMDASPDVYYFSFGHHSGKFIIGLDGEPIVVANGGGHYNVDMSRFGRRDNPDTDSESIIEITTDDGFRYTFGGHFDSMEYMALQWDDITNALNDPHDTTHLNVNYESLRRYREKTHNRVVAYHLTKVEAPNGRTMTLEYSKSLPPILHSFPDKLLLNPSGYISVIDSIALCYTITPKMSAKCRPSSLDETVLSYQMNKIALLKRIKTDRNELSFTYAEIGNPYFDLPRHQFSIYQIVRRLGARLVSINNHNLISNHVDVAQLEYYTTNQSHGRNLLHIVHNPHKGSFSLEYYPSRTGFDSSVTLDIDKWGFWSGKGSNNSYSQIIDDDSPLVVSKMEFNQKEGDSNRNPNEKDYCAFLLKSISFPTGGSFEYTYEPHDYSEYFEWSAKQSYSQSFQHTTGRAHITGGARVKTIRLVDGGDFSKNRVLFYRYNSGDNSRSSGHLLSMGDNYLQGYFSENYNNTYTPCYPDEGLVLNNPLDAGGHVHYTLIREYELYDSHRIDLFTPDSTITYYYHDLEKDLSGIINIGIGNHGGDEIESTWHFYGVNSSVRIQDNNGSEVFHHSFTSQNDEITLYPYQTFGSGHYRIIYSVPRNAVLNIAVTYPFANSLDAALDGVPFKETVYNTPVIQVARNAFWLSYLPESYFSNVNDLSDFYKSRRLMQNKFHFTAIVDRAPESSSIIRETWYNGDSTIARDIQFYYERQNVGLGWYIQCHPFIPRSPFINYANVVQIPLYRYLPVRVVETNMGSNSLGRAITTLTDYDEDGYVMATHQETGERQLIEKYYSRIKHEEGAVYDTLRARNIIRPIVHEWWETDNRQVFSRINHYSGRGTQNNLPLLSQILEGQNGSAPIPRIDYPLYDKYDNPLHMVADGKSSVYLWGYKGKHLVALIQNATPSEVQQALGINLLSIADIDHFPDNFWGNLRNDLPNSSITTYSYLPGVGMISSTGPDMFKTMFSYDSKGRLSTIRIQEKDGSWSIVRAYDYHLINE